MTLLAAGVVMLVLPGPGWLTIVAGLALLARDFEWARTALDHVKSRASQLRDATKRRWRHGDGDAARGDECSDASRDQDGRRQRPAP